MPGVETLPAPNLRSLKCHGHVAWLGAAWCRVPLHKVMMQNMDMSMPMSGNIDKDFATMMSMHHRQALEMIDVYMQHGEDPELRDIAQRMKEKQQKDITTMAPYNK